MTKYQETTPAIQVIAAVIRCGSKILLAQRKRGHLAGKWEFPGGKIEAGESPEDCLARELREEFDIEVRVGKFIATSRFKNKEISIELHGYEVEFVLGDFVLRDHNAIQWVEPESLLDWDIPEADVPIAQIVSGRP